MRALDAYLAAFDDAWSHAWESLSAVLEGVSEEEAYWQAPCYALDPVEDGWPSPGTIAWQIAHLAHCKGYYAAVIRDRAMNASPPTEPRTPLQGLPAERAALKAAHALQRDAMEEVGDEDLGQLASGKMPLGEFLAMTTRHDAWHAAQIALARRLYRTRLPAEQAR